MSEGEENKNVPCGSCGTWIVYFVEVRSVLPQPVQLHGEWYGQEWVWYRPKATCLSPSALHQEHEMRGMLSYEKAMAIAYAVLSESRSFVSMHSIGLDVRVVEAKASWSYSAERIRELPSLSTMPAKSVDQAGAP